MLQQVPIVYILHVFFRAKVVVEPFQSLHLTLFIIHAKRSPTCTYNKGLYVSSKTEREKRGGEADYLTI